MNIETILQKINSIPTDKVAHFASGVICYAVVLPIFGEWPALMIVALSAASKEVYDYLHRDIHTPDVLDAVATTLGGALGLFITRVA